MRGFQVSAALLLILAFPPQGSKNLLLFSHDEVDGPMGGEHQVRDLQVFQDGKVVYVEDAAVEGGVGKTRRSTYRTALSSDEMRQLAQLLDSAEFKSLPQIIPPKTRPIDFFWEKKIEVSRSGETQKIQITNFYPFLNLHQPIYPKVLIEVECRLQSIETAAAKRPKDEDDWCAALVGSEPAEATCSTDETQQPKIVGGVGWGPVRIGADSKAVDAFLGVGKPGQKYADVYFKDYPSKGMQVSFENDGGGVHNIYFYNRQHDGQEFAVFCGKTDKGINWGSSVEEVKMAYGPPSADFSGTSAGATWERLVFAGIDFRFENGKLVHIGIPGN